MSSDGSASVRGQNVLAGVAGASSGTGILAFISTLPDSSVIKPYATFAAPWIAMLVTAVWIHFRPIIDAFFNDIKLAIEIRKAEKELKKIERDPNSTQAIKDNARSRYDALKLAKFMIHENRALKYIKSELSEPKSAEIE